MADAQMEDMEKPKPVAKPITEKSLPKTACEPCDDQMEKPKPVAKSITEKDVPKTVCEPCEDAAPEPEKKEQKQPESEKKKERLTSLQFAREVQMKFAENEPSDPEFTSWYETTFKVKSFRDLKIGARKKNSFFKNYNISWNEDGKINFPTEEQIKEKLKKQVDFYFSDGNLPQDKWLLEKVNHPDNKGERWLEVTELMKFRQVQKWCDSLEFLAESCTTSTEVEFSEDKSKIRRVTPLTLTQRDLHERTTSLYGAKSDNSEELKEFLLQYGKILAFFVKKLQPAPKTKVDVIWSTIEEAQNFAANKQINFRDRDITIRFRDVKAEKIEHVLCAFRIANLPENTAWQDLKDWMTSDEIGLDVRFIKLQGTTGLVRLETTKGEAGVEKLKDKKFKDTEIVCTVIPEEEWKEVAKQLAPPQQPRGGNRKRRNGRQHGNRKRQRRN